MKKDFLKNPRWQPLLREGFASVARLYINIHPLMIELVDKDVCKKHPWAV